MTKPGTNYNARMAWRERELQAEAERALMAAFVVAVACRDGRHRTETDAETGDEVCRYCGAVVGL